MSLPTLDLSQSARHSQAAHFAGYVDPRAGLCATVDAAPLVAWARARGLSVFATTAWAVSAAANAVPALRQRLRSPTTAVEHPVVHPSVAVLTTADTFTHCHLTHHGDPVAFCAAARPLIEAARTQPDLPAPPGDDARLFCTCVPWVAFTQVKHPVAGDQSDSVPRIAWGRLSPTGQLPLALEVHHSLVDGLHMGRFYAEFERLVGALAAG